MNSCVYKGHVAHSRFKPVSNKFSYRLFMLYLDLEEIPSLFDNCLLWSYEKPNIASWYRKNYLGPRDLTLREAVRFRIEDAGAVDPGGPVRMLTHIGYFGLCYNPVTFYYCFDKADENVEVIIAEINNTPWKERHAYVMSRDSEEKGLRFELSKKFHVSPFMPMNVNYDWRFTAPNEALSVHMANIIEGSKYFEADLNLCREEWNPRKLNSLLWRYPLMTLKVIAGIYYQAFRLWVKRTPFYENPEPRPKGVKDFYESVEKARVYREGYENELG